MNNRPLALLLAVLAAVAAFGQTQNPPPQTQTPNPPAAVVNASSDESRTLIGGDGKPLGNVKGTFKGSSGTPVDVTTDGDGKFTAHLDAGDYELTFHTEGLTAQQQQVKVEKGKDIRVPVLKMTCCCVGGARGGCDAATVEQSARTVGLWAALLLGIYWAVALFARYYNIARVNREGLKEAIDATAQEIFGATGLPPARDAAAVDVAFASAVAKDAAAKALAASGGPQNAIAAAVAAAAGANLHARASALVVGATEAFERSKDVETFWFGMLGQIAAGWSRLDEANRIIAGSYNRDQVLARLRLIVEKLRPEYSNVADKIDATLTKINDADKPSDDFLKATLSEGMRCVAEKTQTATDNTLNWQNKAFTLVFIGVCLVIAMAVLLENPILLFLGFIGGFASRLMRGKTSDTPSEAALDWTTLLLSPIYGSVAAWAGILLLVMLEKFNVLGSVFPSLIWSCAGQDPVALGLAFFLGFSERFFSAVTDLAEKSVLDKQNTKASDAPGVTKGSDAKAGIPKAPGPQQP